MRADAGQRRLGICARADVRLPPPRQALVAADGAGRRAQHQRGAAAGLPALHGAARLLERAKHEEGAPFLHALRRRTGVLRSPAPAQLGVDTVRGQAELPVLLNITFPALPCAGVQARACASAWHSCLTVLHAPCRAARSHQPGGARLGRGARVGGAHGREQGARCGCARCVCGAVAEAPAVAQTRLDAQGQPLSLYVAPASEFDLFSIFGAANAQVRKQVLLARSAGR